jgi:uncharacterized membrane protein
MPDDRRRRFLQIERPRGTGDDAPDQSPDTDARFAAVEEPGPRARPGGPGTQPGGPPASRPAAVRPEPSVAASHTARFRPAAERPLEVDDLGEASQPFIRCCRCETDSSRFVARCTTCGAELDTDEQRAFNARLWEARQAEAGAEAEARTAREAALEQDRVDEARARRELAEEMAREVGRRERSRLDGEGFGEPTFGPPSSRGWGSWGSGSGAPGLPIGFRLLGLIQDPTWRVVAGVAAVALAAGLFLFHPTAGLVAAALLVSLLTPGGWRRRRWW